jgi:hypothetical protein
VKSSSFYVRPKTENVLFFKNYFRALKIIIVKPDNTSSLFSHRKTDFGCLLTVKTLKTSETLLRTETRTCTHGYFYTFYGACTDTVTCLSKTFYQFKDSLGFFHRGVPEVHERGGLPLTQFVSFLQVLYQAYGSSETDD